MRRPLVLNHVIKFKNEIRQNKILYRMLQESKPKTRTHWDGQLMVPEVLRHTMLNNKDKIRESNFIKIEEENIKFYQRLTKSKSMINKRVNLGRNSSKNSLSLRKDRPNILPDIFLNRSNNSKSMSEFVCDNSRKVNEKREKNERKKDKVKPSFSTTTFFPSLGSCKIEIILEKYRFLIEIFPLSKERSFFYILMFQNSKSVEAFKTYEEIIGSLVYKEKTDEIKLNFVDVGYVSYFRVLFNFFAFIVEMSEVD